MQVLMRDCTATILSEVAAKEITQRSVAMSYHFAMRSDEATDWGAVNAAIMARWSAAGLDRIKRLAHSGKCFVTSNNS